MKPLFAVLLLLAAFATAAETLVLNSPRQRAMLVELYTSEGCSSCPKADHWLSELKQDERLWKSVIPVAFHVDYWDGLGWKDRFASPRYSARQRNYARSGLVSTVYTPGFVVNGEEWRGWFGRPVLENADELEIGTLRLSLDNGVVSARFAPDFGIHGPLILHLAVTGFELSTEVASGENRGRQLNHDFVALGYERVQMQVDDGGFQGELALPETRINADRQALTAWVTMGNDPRPLQSVGGWID